MRQTFVNTVEFNLMYFHVDLIMGVRAHAYVEQLYKKQTAINHDNATKYKMKANEQECDRQ